jgi:hypothetical protein
MLEMKMFGRPARRDVQRTVDGQAPLVLAIVVRDVDFLHAPLFDGAADALAVTVRGERQLRPGDPADATQRVQFVCDRVCVEARVGGRPAVFLAECLLRGTRTEQPHLDLQQAGRQLLDRADDDVIGVQLAPPLERHVGEGGRRGNRPVGVARNQRDTLTGDRDGQLRRLLRGGSRLLRAHDQRGRAGQERTGEEEVPRHC